MSEVTFELGFEHFFSRRFDVVFDSTEFKALRFTVEDRVTRAIVIIAGLSDRTDTDDVFSVGLEREISRRQLFDSRWRERKDFAEMRVTDQREVTELVIHRQAFPGLLGGKNVLELLEPHGRAVTEVESQFGQLLLVGKPSQPSRIFSGKHGSVGIERLARSLVVIRVVHSARYGSVVVPEDRFFRDLSDQVGAFVRGPAVTYGIAQAVVDVDALASIRLQNSAERLVVRVRIAEDSNPHVREVRRVAWSTYRYGSLFMKKNAGRSSAI
jgi:hypothetical protein